MGVFQQPVNCRLANRSQAACILIVEEPFYFGFFITEGHEGFFLVEKVLNSMSKE